jgi:Na+/H+ antiporter NhaD/arsenite permease-like protein
MSTATPLLVTYAIALMFAGHGVAPVGLLLVMGSADEWVPGQRVGWVSVFVLIVVTILFRQRPRAGAVTQLLAAGGLYISWLLFAWAASEGDVSAVAFHAIFAAPFQITFLFIGVFLLRQVVRKDSAEAL